MRNCIGRVQRRARRCFIFAGAKPVSFHDVAVHCYPGVRKPSRWQRKSIYRALERYGVRAARRGWWQANPELRRQILGK
jgi:hypothetical protein